MRHPVRLSQPWPALRAILAVGTLALFSSCDPGSSAGVGENVGGGGGAASGGSTSSAGASATSGRAGGGRTAMGGGASAGTEAGGHPVTGGNSATDGDAGSGGDAAIGGNGLGGGSGAAGAPPAIAIPARTAADAMGKGFNLGQMFENTQHPQTFAAASAKIDSYYAKGFRNVRIPVTWTEVVTGSLLVNDAAVGDVNRSHPRLAVLQKIVDHALSKPNMYVVLNAHHERALKTANRASVLERLWTDLADIFAARDHRLLFEILNEPHRDDDSAMPAADLRSMTARAYARIRAVDPERIVIIGGNRWFGAAEMAAVWTNLDGVGGGKDPHVMATFHHYDPWTFCGDNQGTYDDAWTDANLSAPMETMLAWASSIGQGMPVYIGEWGVGWGSRYAALECNNIRLWYQKLHNEFAAPRRIPTAVWDDGGWFKIYDHGTNDYANNLVDCISGTCDWTGTERFNTACQ